MTDASKPTEPAPSARAAEGSPAPAPGGELTVLGAVGLDAAGRLLQVNRRAAEHLGYPAEELLGQPLLALFADTPVGRPRAEDVFRRARAGEEVTPAELEMRRRDGSPLWVSLWMQSAAGPSVSCWWVDITACVLAEAERDRLEQYNQYLQEETKSVHNFEEIVGQSPPLRAVLDKVRLVAPTETTVLILGEIGAGKELIARALHALSRRRDRPLIKVNCAALPAGRIESELFGHEKGAFTGAVSRHVGQLELANGGTLFLDEIGEVPPEVQVKLLRMLQEREFERVGGTAPIKVNVRVLAATNRDLRRAREEKAFREDLYYRLSVFPIQMPPLRDRREDIPLLVHFLVKKFAARIGKRIDHVNPATMERLTAYSWPGNVRELENVIERAVILALGPVLEISPDLLGTAAPPGAEPLDLATLEKNHIRTVLDKTKWVIDGPHGAARLLGLHPNTLRSRLKRLGLRRPGHGAS